MQAQALNLPSALVGRVRHRRAGAADKVAPHRHLELEVNLVTAGRATYLIDESRFDMTPNTMVWLFPQQTHVLIDRSTDYTMWVVVLRPETLIQLCTTPSTRPMCDDRPAGVFCKSLPDRAASRVISCFEETHRLEAIDAARHNAALGHAALSAWAAHQEAGTVTQHSDVHPAVERAAMLLQDENQPRNLDDLAEEAGLSPSHLSRLFKRQTGVSLARYRQRQRLDRFLALYGRGGRHNLTEAALAAGFGSYPQFHRVFTEAFGHSPAEYRRRLQES